MIGRAIRCDASSASRETAKLKSTANRLSPRRKYSAILFPGRLYLARRIPFWTSLA